MNRKKTDGRDGRRFYIAYGSNLNVPQMRWRCPTATILGTATLKDWELLFRGSRTGSYLTIGEKEGGTVPVVVWEVTPEDEAALDRYEGYPRFYYKKELKLRCKGIRTGKWRTVNAFVYIMHEDRPFGVPSETYMETCEEGYDTFYFDKRILHDAEKRSAMQVIDRRIEEEGEPVIDQDGVVTSGWLKGFRIIGDRIYGSKN